MILFVHMAEQPSVKSEPVQFGISVVKILLQAADEYGGGGGAPRSNKDSARQYDAKKDQRSTKAMRTLEHPLVMVTFQLIYSTGVRRLMTKLKRDGLRTSREVQLPNLCCAALFVLSLDCLIKLSAMKNSWEVI